MSSKVWKKIKLGEVVGINEKSVSSNYPHKIIEYIDTSSVTNNRFDTFQEMNINEAPSRAKRIVRDGDTIISTVRPIQRHFGFIKKAKENTIASTGFAVLTPKKIHPEFLYYYISQDVITLYLNAIAETTTTTFPAFRPDTLKELEVEIPESVEDQARIASILSALDDKIELNRQANQTLEAIAQAIYKEWFVNFNFPTSEGKLYRDSGGEMQDSELGPIPRGWCVGTLDELVKIESGKRPGEKSELKTNYFNIPLLGASSVLGYVNEALYNSPILIIGRVGTHGVVQRISGPSFPSDNTLVIKTQYYEYIYQILKSIDYRLLNVGSTQPLITQGMIKKNKVLIPMNDVIIKFELLAANVFKKVAANNEEVETLIESHNILLPKLMNGEIEV